MRPPYRRPKLRKDTKGVSEIIGTMLILAMTVVLFSVIIIWVNSFPSPRQATRLDFEGALSFDVDPGPPAKAYANITIVHKGGDVLTYDDTNVYLRVTTGATIRTAKLLTQGVSQGVAYGLIDGSDKDWGTGERWNMKNFTVVPSDTVQVLITDNDKNLLLWDQILKPQVGDRPPLVITAYGDRTPSTQTIDVPMEREPFRFLAYVIDADGDLRTYSVYVVLAFSSSTAYRMYDDGTNGDSRALDGYYTSGTEFTPPSTSWDQGSVRVNATDNAGHQTFHWFRLDVQFNPVPEDDGGGGGTDSGVPTNFICNGDQCYNIFRGGSAAGEWDRSWTEALPKRTFKESEQVVVAILTSRIKDPAKPQILNNFYMYDPFGTPPLHRVVYGSFSSRNVGSNCPPGSPPTNPPQTGRVSCTDSFRYNLTHTSGHYLYVYRFTLNPSGGPVNFASSPCRVSGCNPYQYYFTQYDVFLEIKGSSPQQDPPESKYFKAVDSITITDNSGNYRKFPDIVTYRDSGFTQVVDPDLGQYFNSTDKVYVAVVVQSVDAGCGTGAGCNGVIMGNVVIADYIGGQQVNRAPIAGNQANSPVCAYDGTTCSGATNIFRGMAGALQYQFSLSLSMANQDPWLEGLQNYALSVLSFRDSVPDSYSSPISTPIIIKAPIFKLDLVDASEPLQSNAWGTRDVAYYYENINGIDRWRQYPPLESGPDPPLSPVGNSIRFGNLDGDSDLDIVFSKTESNSVSYLLYYRRDVDANQNTIWTRYLIEATTNNPVKDIDVGDVSGEAMNDIIILQGSAIYYYLNDGLWTKKTVDAAAGAVNAIRLGDVNGDGYQDIVAALNAGVVKLYRNTPATPGTFQAALTYTVFGTPNLMSIDTGNQDADSTNYDDVVVGGANGNIFRLLGGAAGLTFSGNPYASPGGGASVIGVKIVEVCSSSCPAGTMEIMAAYSSSIRIYPHATLGFPLGFLTTITLAAPYNGHPLSSLAAGDFDDDGDDDFAVATAANNQGEILYFRNTNGATGASWDAVRTVDILNVRVFDIDAGDADKGKMSR